jgi:FkbM family methyltransferase
MGVPNCDYFQGVAFDRYTDTLPLTFLSAYWWAKYAPRAKGWLPRQLGRSFGRSMTCHVRTRAGARMAVDPVNLDFYCHLKIQNGVWEPDVLDACLKVILPGDIFYDIGANAGIMTLDVAQTFGNKITIHAFEPQPTLARSLAISIALNGFRNVRLYQTLLGDRQCETDLYIADHGIHTSLITREAGATPLTCRMETLDALVAKGQLPAPTVIKIDVEGAELQVLCGARETLRSAPPTIIFEADENMPRFGYTHRDLFKTLSELGDYSFYHINGSEMDPVNDPAKAALGNYVALPPSRRDMPGFDRQFRSA